MISFLFRLLGGVQPAHAESSLEGTQLEKLIDDLSGAIDTAQEVVLGVGGLVIVMIIIYGGILYITGNPQDGKKAITAAIIGAIIVTLAATIIIWLDTLGKTA